MDPRRDLVYRIDMTEFGTSLGLVRDNIIRMFDKGRPEVSTTQRA